MTKYYNETKVMKHQKEIGGIHTKESRDMVKAWADSKGITYNTRGQFPEKIFMAWIDEHVDLPVEVVDHGSYFYNGFRRRKITIRCHYCAELHYHGSLNLGTRNGEGTRVPHCTGPYNETGTPNYVIVDNTPIEEWELRAVELNRQKEANQ